MKMARGARDLRRGIKDKGCSQAQYLFDSRINPKEPHLHYGVRIGNSSWLKVPVNLAPSGKVQIGKKGYDGWSNPACLFGIPGKDFNYKHGSHRQQAMSKLEKDCQGVHKVLGMQMNYNQRNNTRKGQ
jgi:hypothetical protein